VTASPVPPITFRFWAETSLPRMPDSDDPALGAPAPPGQASAAAPSEVAGRDPGVGQVPQPPGPQVSAWAGELSARVVDGVGWVKARTTVPVVRILRALVYGLIVAVAAVTALVLGILGLVRLWDVYVPVHPLGRRVWLGYVVLGGALVLAGVFLLTRRPGARGKS
jgi:hypothetical protein